MLLADGCGMGKSLQAIAALYFIYLWAKSNGKQDGRVAIVTRASLAPDVSKALKEFCSSLKQEGLEEEVCIKPIHQNITLDFLQFECDVLTITEICKTEVRYAAIGIDEFHEYAGVDAQARKQVMNLRERTGFLYAKLHSINFFFQVC